MSTDPRDASDVPSEPSGADDEPPAPQPAGRIGEGLGVFRALLLTLLFYLVSGFVVWLAWHAWRHWHAR